MFLTNNSNAPKVLPNNVHVAPGATVQVDDKVAKSWGEHVVLAAWVDSGELEASKKAPDGFGETRDDVIAAAKAGKKAATSETEIQEEVVVEEEAGT